MEEEIENLYGNTFTIDRMERCKKLCEKGQRAFNRTLKKAGIRDSTKTAYRDCMELRCNPGCKGTIFEEGPHWFSHMKTTLHHKMRQLNGKHMNHRIDVMNEVFSQWKKERKEVMKESRGKLLNKNSFYRTMKKSPPRYAWMTPKEYKNMSKDILRPSVYKKHVKKQGALSGCHRYVIGQSMANVDNRLP